MSKVIVVGAGASGMMAAIHSRRRGNSVIVIEKNQSPGRKLGITGKGRCNVTNNCDVETVMKNLSSKSKFLYTALSKFTPADTMSFFESLGVKLKTERGMRVFPESDKASDIVDALKKEMLDSGVKVMRGDVKSVIVSEGKATGVVYSGGTLECDSVIIATGGESYPATGSTGDGYEIAKKAGHSITKIRPSLVPMEICGDICPRMQGLSLRNIGLRLEYKGKCIYDDFGEMLFTHFGVSGPVILSASAHATEDCSDYTVALDLKPALDEKTLDQRIVKDLAKYAKKQFCNSLDDLLPQKMIPVIVELSGIPPYKKASEITKAERLSLVKLLKRLELPVRSLRPISEAIITSGGVNTKEINPSTMESKLVHGLYFCGEVIDEDAYTGGFNLQIAFSTGVLAGNHA